MAFCANCGASVPDGAGFCSGCGKAVAASNQATSAAASGAATGAAPAQTAAAPMTSNVAGALAYILGLITGIIFLVLEQYKNDRFVRFHAMQSIFYNVACIVVLIACEIVFGIIFSIAGSISFLLAPLWWLLWLGMFGYGLYLMYQAYSNRQYRIPFLGDLAAKQVGQ